MTDPGRLADDDDDDPQHSEVRPPLSGAPPHGDRSPRNTFEARRPRIPDDVGNAAHEKASGKVTLPLSVFWSSASRVYDLDDRQDRIRVYEQVLREGTDDDVRRYIDIDELIRLWHDLYLPPVVHRTWATWLRERRAIELPCCGSQRAPTGRPALTPDDRSQQGDSPMLGPTHLADQALGSARLDGLADPDPAFVNLLHAYATGELDVAGFEARLGAVIANAVHREMPPA